MAETPRTDTATVKQLGIRVSDSVLKRIEAIARAESNGMSAVVRRLLSAGLQVEEKRSAS